MWRPIALIALLLSVVSGCGDVDSPTQEEAEAIPPPKRQIPVAAPSQAPERSKPSVPRGPTVYKLFVQDLIEGTGEVAQDGDLLLVRFVAGIYENGEEIEYAGSNQPIGFLLGSGNWSYGWESGMPGMRVGGRRELIFPTTPAFVPPGAELGDTLVYVVDLMGISEPPPG